MIKSIKNKLGFTLIESLVSILVVSVAALGLFAVFPMISNQQRDEDMRENARRVVSELLSELRMQHGYLAHIQIGNTRSVIIGCYDRNANPVSINNPDGTVSASSDLVLEQVTLTSTTVNFNGNNIPFLTFASLAAPLNRCPSTDNLEVHVFEDNNFPNNAPEVQATRIRAIAFGRLGSGSTFQVEGATYVVSN